MKKFLFLVALVFGFNQVSNAQRFVYVDTDYIMENMPEYAEAQETLKQLTEQWQGELSESKARLDDLKVSFEANQLLFTEAQKVKKQGEIIPFIPARTLL